MQADHGAGRPLPVINAAGYVTTLGGARLSQDVTAAYAAAAEYSWDMAELTEYASREIAGLTGAPAGCVVSGAAAGLALAVAACAAGDSPSIAATLPAPGKFRVVAQAALHNSYDRMARLCGAEILAIGYATRPGLGQTLPWQLETAVGRGTTAVLHTVTADPSALPLAEVTAIAQAQGVPVIVDAAAELPPAANLSRYLDEGADLVVFSGGKALGGPQDSGLLLGRPDLVRSALYQQLDMDTDPEIWRDRTGTTVWQHGIGRAMKVGPATTFALLAALRQFLSRDHDQEAAEMSAWLQELAAAAGTGRLVPQRTADGFYPSLVWEPGPSRARQAWHGLARRHPSIRLAQAELAAGLLRLRPEAVAPNHRAIVCSALAEVRPLLQRN